MIALFFIIGICFFLAWLSPWILFTIICGLIYYVIKCHYEFKEWKEQDPWKGLNYDKNTGLYDYQHSNYEKLNTVLNRKRNAEKLIRQGKEIPPQFMKIRPQKQRKVIMRNIISDIPQSDIPKKYDESLDWF